MNRLFSRFVLLGFLCLFPLLASTAGAQGTGTDIGGVTVLGPDAEYAGVSRGEWEGQWWQWAASFPIDVNPNFDSSGAMCGFGQSGPIFFSPGNFTGEPQDTTCMVPEGMAIYISMSGAGCSTVEEPPFFGGNEEELTTCANQQGAAILELTTTINGEELPNAMDYGVTSPMFTLNLPDGNFYGVSEGVALSVSTAYSFIIAPPSPGEYEITVSSVFEGASEPFVSTIHFVVVEPTIITPGATPDASPEIATPMS